MKTLIKTCNRKGGIALMKTLTKLVILFFMVVGTVVLGNGYAYAADLIIGCRAEPTIDPHFLYLDTNVAFAAHIYGHLVSNDPNAKRIPSLAVSWKPLNDTTWEFKLRKGVKFHDGTDFTAEDVKFSIQRIPNVPKNPNPYTGHISAITEIDIIDPYTIQFKTDKPHPLLPADMTAVAIISKKAAEGATTADFTLGKAAIGTGPYKFVKYVHGDQLVLKRNEEYWGEKQPWETVTFKIISNDAARVAALLGNTVDLIDFVPPTQVMSLEKNENINVFKRPSDRIIFLIPKFDMDESPYLTTIDGRPLKKNPLKDLRVRKAISMAIDRKATREKVMSGLSIPASQMIPEGWFGYNPNILMEKYNPDAAKKLLSEAGYPKGFGMTIHGPNNRYVNDAKICQAVAQMLSKIGIHMKVDTMPKSIFFSKVTAPKGEYAFFMMGWGHGGHGESTGWFKMGIHTYDKEKGFGALNQAMYSNPELDKLTELAATTVDDTKREQLLRQAMAIAMKDMAVIPFHAQVTISAARKGIVYIPNAQERTLAMNAKLAN